MTVLIGLIRGPAGRLGRANPKSSLCVTQCSSHNLK